MGNKNLSGNGGDGGGEESRVQNSPKAFGELKTFSNAVAVHRCQRKQEIMIFNQLLWSCLAKIAFASLSFLM